MLVQHLTMRAIVAGGLVVGGAGAALLTRTDASSHYAALVLPGLILAGAGHRLGDRARADGTEPRDAGAGGAFWAGAVLTGALIRGSTRFHQEAGQPEPLDEIVGGLI